MFFHIINQCHSFSFNKSLSIFLFFFCFTCFYIFYFIFNFTRLYWFYHISTWIRPFNISCEAILVVVNSSFCFSVVCLITQLCPTLCNPIDCIAFQASLSMGILQAKMLKWIATSLSRVFSQPRDWTQVSHIASRFFTV